METVVRDDVATARSAARVTGSWLTGYRRRVFRGDSTGLALGAPREDPASSAGLKVRIPASDPLAECFAFAAGWDAPVSPAAADNDGLDFALPGLS